MSKSDRQVAVTVGDKGRVTLPDEVRRHLGINTGDVVLVDLSVPDTASIVAVALLPKDQVWFTNPEVQARIAEAHDDILAGRTTAVRGRDDLRARLRTLKKKSQSD